MAITGIERRRRDGQDYEQSHSLWHGRRIANHPGCWRYVSWLLIMNVWVGTSGGNKLVADPWFGDATGVRRQAQQIWVGTATGNKLVYTRRVGAV